MELESQIGAWPNETLGISSTFLLREWLIADRGYSCFYSGNFPCSEHVKSVLIRPSKRLTACLCRLTILKCFLSIARASACRQDARQRRTENSLCLINNPRELSSRVCTRIVSISGGIHTWGKRSTTTRFRRAPCTGETA